MSAIIGLLSAFRRNPVRLASDSARVFCRLDGVGVEDPQAGGQCQMLAQDHVVSDSLHHVVDQGAAINSIVPGLDHLERDAGALLIGVVICRWSLSNLACLLRDVGRANEAEPLFRRAIGIGDKALGVEHPHTRRYQSHYARLLLMTDRAAEALGLGQAALATHERINGPHHPWTKDSARVTADALDALAGAEEGSALRARYSIEQNRRDE